MTLILSNGQVYRIEALRWENTGRFYFLICRYRDKNLVTSEKVDEASHQGNPDYLSERAAINGGRDWLLAFTGEQQIDRLS